MKSPLPLFGVIVLASAFFCTVAQAQKTPASSFWRTSTKGIEIKC